jgi:hypothetical protein
MSGNGINGRNRLDCHGYISVKTIRIFTIFTQVEGYYHQLLKA